MKNQQQTERLNYLVKSLEQQNEGYKKLIEANKQNIEYWHQIIQNIQEKENKTNE
jgi:hypothetical protein